MAKSLITQTLGSPSQGLYDLGQSLWLDNITRDLLISGTLATADRALITRKPYYKVPGASCRAWVCRKNGFGFCRGTRQQ